MKKWVKWGQQVWHSGVSLCSLALVLGGLGVASRFYQVHQKPIASPIAALGDATGDEAWQWQLKRVSDGDTLSVSAGSLQKTVRLCGIDAPEVQHGSTPGQPWGETSADYLRQLVTQKPLHLQEWGHDRYGRSLAWVWVQPNPSTPPLLVNEVLVQQGMAFAYPRSDCQPERFQQAEQLARHAQVGLWRSPPQAPWEFRKRLR